MGRRGIGPLVHQAIAAEDAKGYKSEPRQADESRDEPRPPFKQQLAFRREMKDKGGARKQDDAKG